MVIPGCWFRGSLKAFLSPPSRRVGLSCRDQARHAFQDDSCPSGQEPASWAQSKAATQEDREVEGTGRRFARWSEREIWKSPRHLDNLTLPPLLPSSGQNRRGGFSHCHTHGLPFCVLSPNKTCLGIYSLVPSLLKMLIEGWGTYHVI